MLPSNPAKVAYVLKRYPRYSETFIVNEILAHEAAGLEVEIFSLRPPCDTHFQDVISRVRAVVNYLPHEGIKAPDMWTAIQEAGELLPGLWDKLPLTTDDDWRDLYQALLLARETRLKGIVHLHAHFGTVATAVARLASRFTGVPYTFTAHAKDIFHESVEHEELRRKMSDAAAVVTVSNYNLRYLREQYGEAAASVRRIYNGLDLERFSYSLPYERSRTIISVGRLVEKKGMADLVSACAILRERGVEFETRIIGSGPLEADLMAQIEGLGLGEQVRLLGARPQREVMECVQGAAVFASPCVIGADSNRDGLPTVLLEAMALGTPCIATDVTGIPEVVRDGETGLLLAQHDPTSLAGALEQMLDDSGLRIRLATQARKRIEDDFDIHTNSADLRELFTAERPEGTEGTREYAEGRRGELAVSAVRGVS